MASAEEMVRGKKYRLWAELGRLPNGKRDRRSKVVEASGKKEAKKMAQDFEDDLKEKMKLNGEIFFTVLLDMWLKNYAYEELEDTTIEHYEVVIPIVDSYFKKYRVKDITPLMIVEFMRKERKAGRGSLIIKYKLLLSIFKHAVMWKVIRSEDNPMENQPVPKPLHRQQNKDFYRSHEIPVMLELLKEREEKNQLIVLLALTGALRRGEIAGLTTDMIDFKNNRIHIKYSLQYSKRNGLKLKSTKTSEERIVTFPEKFMKRLHKHYIKVLNLKMEMGSLWKGFKDVNGKEVIMLFSNEYGIPQRPDSITQFWNRFTLKNEDVLRRIRFHDLRHSSATFILNEGSKKGLNIKTVQKRLGHTDIKTTLRLYSHVSEEDDVTAGDLFEKFL